jgi:hypothetical protein
MKRWTIRLVLALAVGALAGCGQGQATPTPAAQGAGETYSSTALDTSYDDALDASTQLVLGTLRLEETGNAVTPEQAQSLLPLWQSLQGGVTAQVEVNAVLKQIEKTMTQDQLAAIAAMRLTQEDLRSWMQEQGVGGGFAGPGGGQELSPDELATRQAEFGNMSEEDRANLRATMEAEGGFPEGGFPGGGQFGNMSEEERANMRATMEAGGGFRGGGQFDDLSEEERANIRATIEAGGGGMSGGPGSGGGMPGGPGRRGGLGTMLNPLIELLTQRAAK